MIYREAGQFKTSYTADQAVFPILQDRAFILLVLVVAFVVVPIIADDYWLKAILIPFLVYALAAVGLNILTGYAGQVSLGTGGFMAVGAYMSYKLTTTFPELNIIVVFVFSGCFAAVVGIVFGIPSLRIKGFYLAVATLAAQFFLIWLFNRVGWFYNYNPSGTIDAPPRAMFGLLITGASAAAEIKYLTALTMLTLACLMTKNLVRGRVGRAWMAIRDMDIAAEIIGIRPLHTKLLAFAISSFVCGIAGAEMFMLHLGSVMGSILGAGFMVLTPILLTNIMVGGMGMQAATAKHIEFMVFGGLIIFFLIVEPNGLARLWQIAKEKLRLWPFPH